MERIISQIYLLPTTQKDRPYLGLLPCDGRHLRADRYQALYHLIGDRYGGSSEQNLHNEAPKYYFALPKLESPLEGYSYHICVIGTFPQFE